MARNSSPAQTTGAFPPPSFPSQQALDPPPPITLLTHPTHRRNITSFHGGSTYLVELGPIGRDEGKTTGLNADIEKFVPLIVGLVEKELVVPNPYDVVGEGGFEDVIEAFRYQQKGAGGSDKVVVKIQDP